MASDFNLISRVWLATLLVFWALAANAGGKPDFLVDADWLAQKLNDPKLVVLEVRFQPHRYFTVGHIPGAVQVQRFKDVGDNHAVPTVRFPSRETFERTLRRWGVNNDSTIVLYDDFGTLPLSPVYFLLDLYGFDMKRVKILNGGTAEWSAFNDMQKVETKRKPGNVRLKPAKSGMVVEWTDVYSDVLANRNPAVVLLDTRPELMYSGQVVLQSLRGGHVPGAINIVSLNGVDVEGQVWKSLDEIAALYQSIPKGKTIYTYCQDNARASLAWLQLKALGYKDVRVYNAGWSDWGNNLVLPVSLGEEPYDATFAH